VARIPKNLEGGEVSLTNSPSGHLGFKAESFWLTGSAKLQLRCRSGMALFDY
jgi:hypothetical protein